MRYRDERILSHIDADTVIFMKENFEVKVTMFTAPRLDSGSVRTEVFRFDSQSFLVCLRLRPKSIFSRNNARNLNLIFI